MTQLLTEYVDCCLTRYRPDMTTSKRNAATTVSELVVHVYLDCFVTHCDGVLYSRAEVRLQSTQVLQMG